MFVAVAEEGSFTRAADRLHVVQSAVSAGVRNLERELGARLFDRSTHTVQLSDAGRALLPEARATLAAAGAARDTVDAVRGGVRGTVVLGNMQAQGMRSIDVAGMLAEFRAEHPAVEVQIRQGGSLEMTTKVRDGELDLAFVALPISGSPASSSFPWRANRSCSPWPSTIRSLRADASIWPHSSRRRSSTSRTGGASGWPTTERSPRPE